MMSNKNQLNVKTSEDMTATELNIEADVVIIGSGAGGGISAYELAKAGKKVIILEAGPFVPSEKFTEMMAVKPSRASSPEVLTFDFLSRFSASM